MLLTLFVAKVVTLFKHTVFYAYSFWATVSTAPEEFSAVTHKYVSHRANLGTDWTKVLLVESSPSGDFSGATQPSSRHQLYPFEISARLLDT